METASLMDASVQLVQWQINSLGVVGTIVFCLATLLWSCCTWLIVDEWRRLRRRHRPQR